MCLAVVLEKQIQASDAAGSAGSSGSGDGGGNSSGSNGSGGGSSGSDNMGLGFAVKLLGQQQGLPPEIFVLPRSYTLQTLDSAGAKATRVTIDASAELIDGARCVASSTLWQRVEGPWHFKAWLKKQDGGIAVCCEHQHGLHVQSEALAELDRLSKRGRTAGVDIMWI
jgi:hypothetical protein